MATRAHRYRVTVEHVGTPHEGEPFHPPLSFAASNHDEILGIAPRMAARLGLAADEGAQLAVGMRLLGEFLLQHRNEPLYRDFREQFRSFGKTLREHNAPAAAEAK